MPLTPGDSLFTSRAMKTRRTVWANGFLFAALVAATAVGCGSDDDDDGSGGSGGTAGKGGSAGTGKGGTSGKGGSSGAGTGGSAGKGGSAGSSGKGGSSGSGGSAGTSGEGSGGDAGGEAGASGTPGSGGSSGDGGGSGGTDAGGAGATGDGGTEAGGTGGDAAGAGGVSGGEGGVGGEPSVEETACELYCGVMMSTCGDSGEHAQYPDEAQCLATCAVFPEGTTGNSLGCRATHAALAATQGADPHCDHAGPAGVGMCGSNCESYCSLMMNVCTGTFASNEACLTACGEVPANTFTNFVYPAPAGNTLSCRIAHATNAAASTGTARTNHCSHAAGAAPCN
jgi:hypothetical protein